VIKLVQNTIDKKDIATLISWLKTEPKLTKGEVTEEFESQWSEWLGVKHSIFVNSGSSANLTIFTALKYLGRISGSVVVPAVSWATTVAPLMQLGFDVTLCECDRDTLGLNTKHLRKICEDKRPSVVVLVHVLGIPCDMDEIISICKEYDVILVEDSCESVGSTYNGIMTGAFGLASSFSFFAGHHMSVSPDTPIPYLDKNGMFDIDSIEAIYSKHKDNIEDIKIITFDQQTYNTFYKTPKKIIRHLAGNKSMFRLNLVNGRYVDITQDHSVFTYDKDNFEIISKRGDEIISGDRIIVPSSIPPPTTKTKLDFLAYCKTIKNSYFARNYDADDLNFIKPKWNSKENKQKFNWKKRGVLPIEYLRTKTSNLRIAKKNTPRNKYIPAKYVVTKDLCRLVGYFLAEGSYKKSGIAFSFNICETEYISDVKKIIKDTFGLDTYSRIIPESKSHTVLVSSETLLVFFKGFLKIKSGASNKQIPRFVFNSSRECIASLLYGYFAGDGTRVDNKRISVTSVSKKMINEISYLFSTLGLNGSVIKCIPNTRSYSIKNKQIKNKKPQYKFVIANVELNVDSAVAINPGGDLARKKLAFYVNRNKDGRTVYYRCSHYIKTYFSEYMSNKKLKRFVDSDLTMLRVKSIEPITRDYEYVYDFCVEGTENFIGGWQPICLHNSTMEGGMICTDDDELYETMKSIRCHGWDRDLSNDSKKELRNKYGIDDFRALYTFYWQAYNFRPTDLQARIGLSQMEKIDYICEKRHENLLLYDSLIENDYWKLPIKQHISSFAYPIITPKIKKVVEAFNKNGIEVRPLVCGSIGRQPFWVKEMGETRLPFADIVHDFGLYVPNNHQIEGDDIKKICEVFNHV